jgi:DNA processing protein
MDLHEAVALSVVPGLGRIRAAAAFKELRDHSGIDGVRLEHVVDVCVRDADTAALAARAREDAAKLLTAAARLSIVPIDIDDDRYPPLLRAIVDPPAVLWVRGDAGVLAQTAVAIIGSRAASPYALEVANRLGGELGDRGVTVVSGLARGADGAAHRGCLGRGGRTIAVLGSGPDVVYPPEHGALAAEICGGPGALVSELGPGAPPLPEHFPLRNRLISGISLAVVVVEASDKSGSLITARCALDQGRDVMAVPGSVLGGRNRGSHALLKDGAKVVETADDILEELGWPCGGLAGIPGPQISRKLQETDGLLQKLNPGEAYDLDELSFTLEREGARLLPLLTDWEMRGVLVRLAGGRYALPPGQTS